MFKSLKSRGLAAGVAVIIGLLVVAFYGQNLLDDSQQKNQSHSQQLIRLNQQLIQIKKPLASIESSLFQFLLSLEKNDIDPVHDNLTQLLNRFNSLRNLVLIQQISEARIRLDRFDEYYWILFEEVEKILNFTNQQRFPTMGLLLDQINPLIEDFNTHTQIIESLLKDNDNKPASVDIHRLVEQLKYYWSQSVSSTRLMISSRTGIFGNPLAAQQIIKQDMEHYEGMVNRVLEHLEQHDEPMNDIEFTHSLKQLRDTYDIRNHALKALVIGLGADDWRRDRYLMLTRLKPVIDQMNAELSGMERIAEQLSTENLQRINLTGEQLSRFLWGLSLIFAALILSTYFIFEFLIRKPMEQVANAMLSEASEVTCKPLKPVGAIEIDNLISAFEQMQKQIRWRQDKLADQVQQLDASLKQLKQTQKQLVESEKMASLAGLVAGVAHEINTPIGVSVTASSHLQNELSLVQKQYDNESLSAEDLEQYLEDAHSATSIILSNLQRAASLIKSFKQVAVDQSSAEIRQVNLREYIDEVVMNLHPKLKKTQHTVKVDIAEDINLTTVPGAIAQIITNMVINSLLHAFDGIESGEIHILAHIDGEMLELVYQDNGHGIAPDVQPKIFEPFFTTKRGAGGSGLGMHISYNLVTNNLKGQIGLISEPGQGVQFTMRFPLNIESTPSLTD